MSVDGPELVAFGIGFMVAAVIIAGLVVRQAMSSKTTKSANKDR